MLADANGPMRVSEIGRFCEAYAGTPVNRSAVSDCLIKHSLRERRVVDRIARGSYERHRGLAAPIATSDRA